MDKFGFIVHPISISNVHSLFYLSRCIPSSVLKKLLLKTPPFIIEHLQHIRSLQGNEIEGYFIACPILSEQILSLDEDFVVSKIISAANIAKRLKVNIIGLGGLAGYLGNGGNSIAEKIGLPVTNGTTYGAYAVIEVVKKAVQLKGLDLSRSKIAIIGATNLIGKLCSMVYSKQVDTLLLSAKNESRLKELSEDLKRGYSAKIINCNTDVQKAAKEADIIIFTTTAVEVKQQLKIEDFKKNVIICDIPVPRNITSSQLESRPDIFLIDGAAVIPPFPLKMKINFGIASGHIYACMAETMMLTMEKKFENFSIGWQPSLEKLEIISALAKKHGFSPAFTSQGRSIVIR